ncbi:hypothetical protein M0802_004948 [Mischocyttarus mexicanus]|nr:hypothetical protein M0802_004948 [Mischocyttarus mexicanus]
MSISKRDKERQSEREKQDEDEEEEEEEKEEEEEEWWMFFRTWPRQCRSLLTIQVTDDPCRMIGRTKRAYLGMCNYGYVQLYGYVGLDTRTKVHLNLRRNIMQVPPIHKGKDSLRMIGFRTRDENDHDHDHDDYHHDYNNDDYDDDNNDDDDDYDDDYYFLHSLALKKKNNTRMNHRMK